MAKNKLIIIILVLSCLEASALEYAINAGKIQALDNGKIVWENLHDAHEEIKREYKAGPIEAGAFVYYSIGMSFYIADKKSGIIKNRILLPGFCKKIEQKDKGVTIRVCSFENSYTWQKTYTIPEEQDIPFYFYYTPKSPFTDKKDAENVLEKILEEAGKKNLVTLAKYPPKEWKNDLVLKHCLEQVISRLEELAERNPTNLWYSLQEGIYLDILGQRVEALGKFQQVLECPFEYSFQLLRMVHIFDTYQIILGDKAFEKGMRFLVAKGYEPELMNNLINLMLLYGRPRKEKIDPVKDIDYLNKLGERIWNIAPYAEGSCFLFHGLMEANKEKGNWEAVKTWKNRRDAATPYRISGVFSFHAERTGHALTIIIAIIMGFPLLLIVKSLKIKEGRFLKRFMVLNIFRYYTKSELMVFLLVIFLGIFALYTLYVGFSTIYYAMEMPFYSLNGFLNHPDVLEYFKKLRSSESGKFIYAFMLHKSGDIQAADEIYQNINSPQSLNNRGVIAYQRGDRQAASVLFQKTLEKDNDFLLATFNLGEKISSPRIERLIKYGGKLPFLSLPTEKEWIDVFTLKFLDRGVLLKNETPDGDVKLTIYCYISTLLLGIFGLFIIFALFLPKYEEIERPRSIYSYIRYIWEWILPGSSQRWGFSGPIMLILFFVSLIVLYIMSTTGGMATNFIDAVALPSVQKAYGYSKTFQPPLSQFFVCLKDAWWILWIINGIYLLLISKRKQ